MKSLFILGMVLLSASAFAGNEKGNGGGIHYCASQKTQELYDIYEAQARYNFDIKKSNLAVDVQVNKVIEKIKKTNPYIGREFEKQITYLRNRHMVIRANVSLMPIGDAKILVVDNGCSYKQLANWDEVSGNLIVNKDYFDRMDNLNKAALYTHEALYKVGRDLDLLPKEEDGTTTSDTIRRMVGEIFSTRETLEQMWDVVDPQIAIDKQNTVNIALIQDLKDLATSCVDTDNEYNQFASAFKIDCNSSLDELSAFITKHLEFVSICSKNLNELSPENNYGFAYTVADNVLAEAFKQSQIANKSYKSIDSKKEKIINTLNKCDKKLK